MTKQTIEIDVPEGYEIFYDPGYGREGEPPLTIRFKEKEPKYIEVREYLFMGWAGNILLKTVQKNLGDIAATIESSPHFIRWIDEDWRKIYI